MYEGEWKDGMREGVGRETSSNGEVVTGNWVKGNLEN